MKINKSLIIAILLFCSMVTTKAQDLNENLNLLKPFLNIEWVGKLNSPDGKMELTVNRIYEMWNQGNVIKYIKTNKELVNYGEGYFYWNDIEKKIAFFSIENKGIYCAGFVTVENNIITIEGTMTWPKPLNPQIKQSYEFKNTFEFTSDGKMIDKWYQNGFGPWQPGHIIIYENIN